MAQSPLSVPIPSIAELTQNSARLLQQSLADAIQSANPAQLTPTDVALARSNVRALSFVQGVGLHGAYRYLRDFVARQAIPIKAADEFLDGWLNTYGLPRKPASAAFGAVNGTGVAGSILAAGTLLQRADNRQYKVTADAVVAAGGTVVAQVIALLPGIASNTAGGTQLQLVSPVSGVDSAFTADAVSGLSGGADVEKDSEAIYRLQQRLSNEPMGGSPADYTRWALQVPGITRAWGLRNPSGPTSAGVIIMADGNTSNYGLPTETQRQQVYDYIADPRRGPPDELFVIVPTPVVTNWTVGVVPDTAANRTAVQAAIADVYYRESVPGGSIPYSHFGEAISGVVGEYNHTIAAPAITSGGTLQAGAFDRLLVLGTVGFA